MYNASAWPLFLARPRNSFTSTVPLGLRVLPPITPTVLDKLRASGVPHRRHPRQAYGWLLGVETGPDYPQSGLEFLLAFDPGLV